MSTTKRAFGWVAVAGLILACADLARSEPQSLVLADPNTTVIPRVPKPPNPPSDLANLPGDLRAIAIPGPPNIGDFVKDPQAAIVLGKALFWDMQVGSDGVQACASCHFRAGADPRSKNQFSPGLKVQPTPDLTFFVGEANFQLDASFFPLTQLATLGVRGALNAATDNNDAVSSMGVHHLGPGADPQNFRVGNLNTRRVELRNTPTVINAVFNHRQFWDGRAENVFNGVDHRGTRNPDARVFRADDPNAPVEVAVALVNSSLASQAVAPIVADLEMARPGRTVQEVGRELVKNGVRPLKKQRVHPSDSVLGPHSRYPAKGLTAKTYAKLIEAAFNKV
ncbi:MAG: cytochrome-c peroxidase [Chromatiales bacterium]